MSEENVENVRSFLAAFADGNLKAVFAACDPGIELEVTDAYFDAPRTYYGRAGMQELFDAHIDRREARAARRPLPRPLPRSSDSVSALGPGYRPRTWMVCSCPRRRGAELVRMSGSKGLAWPCGSSADISHGDNAK